MEPVLLAQIVVESDGGRGGCDVGVLAGVLAGVVVGVLVSMLGKVLSAGHVHAAKCSQRLASNPASITARPKTIAPAPTPSLTLTLQLTKPRTDVRIGRSWYVHPRVPLPGTPFLSLVMIIVELRRRIAATASTCHGAE